jgi:hypothetical protein
MSQSRNQWWIHATYRAESLGHCNRRSCRRAGRPGRIDTAAAARLEASLEKQPDNVIARWELLNYYYTNSDLDPAVKREARRRHILWMITNRPEDLNLSLPVGKLTITGPVSDAPGSCRR